MRFSKSYIALLLIVLLAFVLRVYRLDFFSLRGDESFTVLFVGKPLAQMWYETLTVEPNPPLLYFALRGWIAVAGASEFVTRFFSLFFGVLCVPLVYRLTRVLTRLRSFQGARNEIALFAAFLIAINPYQIWHSQDVRNYTMWPAQSLLALCFFWQWYTSDAPQSIRLSALQNPLTTNTPRTLSLLLFVLAELAALYTHYYEAFLLLALNVFVFATTWRDVRKLGTWIGAQIVLAILYLPYPLILSNRVSAYGEGSGRQGVALWDIARETFSAFVLGDTMDATVRAWLWIPFALLALGGLVWLARRNWRQGFFFVLYATVPTLAVFALNTIRPLYLERYLNGIAPVYYLLLAFGIVALANTLQSVSRFSSRRSISPLTSRLSFLVSRFSARRPIAPLVSRLILLAALVSVSILSLSNYWTNPAYAKAPDWRGLTDIINTKAQPGDLIVQNFPETSLLYYDKTKLPLVVYPETYLPDTRTTQQLNGMGANYNRVWFIPAAPDVWDPDEFVEQWLAHRADLLDDWEIGDFRLQLYGTASQFLNTMHPVDRTFGKVLTLRGYRTERDGDTLRLVLYWRAIADPQASYDVQIETLNAGGTVRNTRREVPVHATYPTTLWRKNEIVVDQHDLPNDPDVQALRVSICNGDTCFDSTPALPLTTP